jgi:hypothetical protein
MDKELWQFCKDSFCNHLRSIKSDVELNGGSFRCHAQLDDMLDCVNGVKSLLKIKAADGTTTATV